MNYKLLIFFGFLALLKVANGDGEENGGEEEKMIRCYDCNRWQVGIFNGGDKEDECIDPEEQGAPVSDKECYACKMDTRMKVFDWVDRGCVTKKNKCINGTVTKSFVDVDFLDLSDATDYDVERSCCFTDLCNKEYFFGAATSMRANSILFVPALFFIFFWF